MEYRLNLFKLLNSKDSVTQREIANELKVSLGKVNATIKQLEEEKYIKIKEQNGKKFYKLTEKSFNELKDTVKNAKEIRINIHEDDDYIEPKLAVILAAGQKKDFDKPVSFLELEEKNVIERAIEILKNYGIEKIVIVAGYKKEFYEEYAINHEEVKVIINEEYKWTGSMSSLAKAKEEIDGDFILVENDLVFEELAIKNMMESPKRDLILITNETGSGDEAFVEIRNEKLFKMSKDIHQFNKIDGEMVGISKISLKLYEMMLEEFLENLNPYMNYEYTMLDVSRSYNIACEKIVDLVWGEVDNREQYKKIRELIYPKIKRKELNNRLDYVRDVISKSIDIEKEEIVAIYPIGGMTNKNYKVKTKTDNYIARIPGNGTEGMINRHNEMINSLLASKMKIDAEIVFFDELSGIKVSKYIEGAETINGAMAKNKENMKAIAQILKKLHNSDIDMKNEFDVFEEIEKYENLMISAGAKSYEGYKDFKIEIEKIKEILNKNGRYSVPCHIDTVPENFVKDIHGKIYLIDWEYSGLNDPMWDIAAHFIECEFNEDQEELFLKYYFEDEIKLEDKIRILSYKICQDFLWSIWTIVKEAQGDDFGTYGIDRYNRGKSNLKNLEKLMDNKKNIYI